jgi:hypothetical protein
MTTRGAGSEDLRENFMLSEWADVDLVKAQSRRTEVEVEVEVER